MAAYENWREEVNNIADALGVNEDGNWRNDLHAIAEYVAAGGGGGGGGVTPAQVQQIVNASLVDYPKIPADEDVDKFMGYYNGQWYDGSPVGNTLKVDFTYTGTKEDGSQLFPYKTLQAAIDAADTGDLIIVGIGQSTESLTITKHNLTIIAEGTDGQYRTKIVGNLTLSPASYRIGLTGLEISGAVRVQSTQGLVYADFCDFGSLAYTASMIGYSKMKHCYFENGLTVSTSQGAIVEMQLCQFENSSIATVANSTAIFYGCRQLTLNHTGGRAIIYGDTQCVAGADNKAIVSIAAESDNNGLYLLSGTTFNGLTHYIIEKTGTCVYGIGAFLRDPNVDTLTGTRIEVGSRAEDVLADITPANYTAASNYLVDHLKGIDTALASSGGGGGNPPDTEAFKDKFIGGLNGQWYTPQFTGTLRYVSYAYTGDIVDGSVLFPYKSLVTAITTATPGTTIFILSPGDEAVSSTTAVFNNVSIINLSGTRSRIKPATATGLLNFTINLDNQSGHNLVRGVEFERVGFNILRNQDNSDKVEIVFDDCIINNNVNLASITVANSAKGLYLTIQNCTFGWENINWQLSEGQLVIDNCTFGEFGYILPYSQSTGSLIYIKNCTYPMLNHQGGYLHISNTSFKGTTDTPWPIQSYADGAADGLFLDSGTMYDGTQYWPIRKVGSCYWVVGAFIYEPTISDLDGAKKDAGMHANDIYSHNSSTNYTRANDTVYAHLDGIDAALGSLGEKVIIQNLPVRTGDIGEPEEIVDIPIEESMSIIARFYAPAEDPQYELQFVTDQENTFNAELTGARVFQTTSVGMYNKAEIYNKNADPEEYQVFNSGLYLESREGNPGLVGFADLYLQVESVLLYLKITSMSEGKLIMEVKTLS